MCIFDTQQTPQRMNLWEFPAQKFAYEYASPWRHLSVGYAPIYLTYT